MTQTIKELHRAIEKNDIPASVDAHLQFHSLFYDFSDTARCAASGMAGRPNCASTSLSTTASYSDLHDIAVEHARLAEVALEGDTDAFKRQLAHTSNQRCAARPQTTRTPRPAPETHPTVFDHTHPKGTQ